MSGDRYLTSLPVNTAQAMLDAAAAKAAKRRHKQIDRFKAHHGLSDMYKLLEAWIYARQQRQWEWMNQSVFLFVHSFSRLSETERDYFSDALPGRPSIQFPEGSDGAWCAYLCSLLAVPARRDNLRQAIRQRITEGWGEEYVPQEFTPDSFFGDPGIPTF